MNRRQIENSQRTFIRSEVSVWGFAAVLGNIAVSAAVIIIQIGAELFGIDISGIYAQYIMQIFLSALLMSLPFIIGAAYKGLPLKSLIKIKRVPVGLFLPLVMLGLGGSMLANNMTGEYTAVLRAFGLYPQSPTMPIPSGISGALLFIFTTSVMPAVFEEFAYRGILLGALRPYGNGFAIIASGLLFGLMHSNLVQIPFAFVLGCIMGYINVVADSILPSVTVHFISNFTSCIQQLALEYCSEDVASAVIVISIVALLLLGIIGFVLICRKSSLPFAPLHETVPVSVKVAVSGFLTSNGTVAAYIIFGGDAIVNALFNSAGI